MEVTPEGIAKAMNAAGITGEQLFPMMRQLALLGQKSALQTSLVMVDGERARVMAEMEQKRQSITGQIAAIDGELEKLVAP